MLTELFFHFQICRKPSCSTRCLFIAVTFITIGFVLIKEWIIAFDEIVPLENHLIHQLQQQVCTASGSISVTVNHEEAGAKRLQHLGVFNSNWSLSRSDSKHRYKFLDFISSGNKFLELSKKYTVTIATQSSLEKLHYIVEVSRQWTGPISLAVFVAGEEYRLTEVYISYLRQCFTHVKDQISFHLAYSWNYPPSDGPNRAFDYKQNCSNPEAVLSDLLNIGVYEQSNGKTIGPTPRTICDIKPLQTARQSTFTSSMST